uniref:Uncharacterized protein R4 n=1 Tax=Haloquadratum walsbyi TaxID=293091 RepID=A0A445MQH4_9EURY|nr:uncharacterized protein R4 [Haloquadratum walsbyi]
MKSQDTGGELSVVSAKVPRDLQEQIEDIQQEDESRSNALRRIIRRGVENDQTPTDFKNRVQGVAIGSGTFYIVSYFTLTPTVQSIIGGTAIILIAILSLYPDIQEMIPY